jgi:glycosyltransferase involved in cell wall biosynthesis
MISVCTATYNHRKVIAKAIESVLMQETSFDYELVIGEDCSTDNTWGIVADYQRRYPNRIRAIHRERNLGAYENGIQTLAACSGKYISLLDGDDYWTDASKLQRQVDVLEANLDVSGVFHKTHSVNDADGNVYDELKCRLKDNTRIGAREVIERRFYIHVSSLVFRRTVLAHYPFQWHQKMSADYVLAVVAALHGDLVFIDRYMSVYRLHAGGVTRVQRTWEEEIRRDMGRIGFFAELDRYTHGKFRPEISRHFGAHCRHIGDVLKGQSGVRKWGWALKVGGGLLMRPRLLAHTVGRYVAGRMRSGSPVLRGGEGE